MFLLLSLFLHLVNRSSYDTLMSTRRSAPGILKEAIRLSQTETCRAVRKWHVPSKDLYYHVNKCPEKERFNSFLQSYRWNFINIFWLISRWQRKKDCSAPFKCVPVDQQSKPFIKIFLDLYVISQPRTMVYTSLKYNTYSIFSHKLNSLSTAGFCSRFKIHFLNPDFQFLNQQFIPMLLKSLIIIL